MADTMAPEQFDGLLEWLLDKSSRPQPQVLDVDSKTLFESFSPDQDGLVELGAIVAALQLHEGVTDSEQFNAVINRFVRESHILGHTGKIKLHTFADLMALILDPQKPRNGDDPLALDKQVEESLNDSIAKAVHSLRDTYRLALNPTSRRGSRARNGSDSRAESPVDIQNMRDENQVLRDYAAAIMQNVEELLIETAGLASVCISEDDTRVASLQKMESLVAKSRVQIQSLHSGMTESISDGESVIAHAGTLQLNALRERVRAEEAAAIAEDALARASQAEEHARSLQQLIDEKNEELTKLNNELKSAPAAIELERMRVEAEKAEKLAEAAEQRAQIESEAETYAGEIQDLRNTIRDFESDMKELRDESKIVRQKNNELEEQLSDAKAVGDRKVALQQIEFQKVQELIDDSKETLETQNRQATKEIDVLKSKLEASRADCRRHENNVKLQGTRISTLSISLHAAKQTLNDVEKKLTKNLDTSNAEVERLSKEATSSEQNSAALQAEIDEQKKTIRVQKQELYASTSKLKVTESKMETVKQELELKVAAVKHLQSYVDELEKVALQEEGNSSDPDEGEEASEHVNLLKGILDHDQEQIQALTLQLAATKQVHIEVQRSMEAERDDLKKELESLHKEYNDTRAMIQQLSQLSEELTSKLTVAMTTTGSQQVELESVRASSEAKLQKARIDLEHAETMFNTVSSTTEKEKAQLLEQHQFEVNELNAKHEEDLQRMQNMLNVKLSKNEGELANAKSEVMELTEKLQELEVVYNETKVKNLMEIESLERQMQNTVTQAEQEKSEIEQKLCNQKSEAESYRLLSAKELENEKLVAAENLNKVKVSFEERISNVQSKADSKNKELQDSLDALLLQSRNFRESAEAEKGRYMDMIRRNSEIVSKQSEEIQEQRVKVQSHIDLNASLAQSLESSVLHSEELQDRKHSEVIQLAIDDLADLEPSDASRSGTYKTDHISNHEDDSSDGHEISQNELAKRKRNRRRRSTEQMDNMTGSECDESGISLDEAVIDVKPVTINHSKLQDSGYKKLAINLRKQVQELIHSTGLMEDKYNKALEEYQILKIQFNEQAKLLLAFQQRVFRGSEQIEITQPTLPHQRQQLASHSASTVNQHYKEKSHVTSIEDVPYELLGTWPVVVAPNSTVAGQHLNGHQCWVAVSTKDIALLDKQSWNEIVSWPIEEVINYGTEGVVVSLECDGPLGGLLFLVCNSKLTTDVFNAIDYVGELMASSSI